MEIGIIILSLFVFMFIGTLCGMLKIYLDIVKDADGVYDSKNTYEYIKKMRTVKMLGAISAVCFTVIIISVIGLCIAAANHNNTVETVPETGVIETTEVTECTTAPETILIIPTSVETIHIEETDYVEPSSKAPSATVSEEEVSSEGLTDLEMLACVIYQEAGGNGSCDDCRRYVADIVLNRVNDSRFPNSIYEVLTAKRQYGKFYWTGIKWPDRANNPGEAEAVARAYRIAQEVLDGQHSKLYGQGYVWQAGFKQGKEGFWCCGHYYGKS